MIGLRAAARVFATTSDFPRCGRRLQPPPSASPTSCRTCSAKACSRPRSFPVYARLLAEGDEEEAGRVAGAVAAILALVTSVAGAARRAGHALSHRCDRPGLPRSEARTDHPPGAHPVSRRGPAGALGLVPGHPEQPSQVLSLLHRAGGLEPGHDRHAGGLRRPPAQDPPGRRPWRGARWPAARCNSACSCRWCCAWRASLRVRLDTRARSVREVIRNFVPGVHQPRRGADQRLRGCAAGQPAGRRARWPASPTRRRSTLLPVSLFGMSVSAAELPAMSSALGDAGRGRRATAPAPRMRACARSRFSSCLPPWRSWRSAASSRPRLFQSGGFTARRFQLRLGHPGRLRGGPAGVDAGPALFFHLLCPARHAHAAASTP